MLSTSTILRTVIAILLLAASCAAQQPAPPTSGTPGLDAYRQSRVGIYMNDFAELSRYRDANAKLSAPAKEENRVVFFGDSITDFWHLDQSFPGKPYINRGIGGQTTLQMLGRFQQDVIALQPKVVVILAGTNDIAGNTGPVSLEDIETNFTTMAELARLHGIRVVFSSILPVHNYTPQSQELFITRPMPKIRELNRWMQTYCAANGCVYIDYFPPLVDASGLLRRELAEDGLHPTAEGYKLMAPLAEAAIARVPK